jgi:LmbE family N-acetylglucosaminyl deacetylase
MTRAAAVLAAWRSLPLACLDRICGGRPLLVLAPHPDDESLGCGGLIAETCARGEIVHVAILTGGTRSHPNSKTHPAPRLKALREAEARAAVGTLGLPQKRLGFLALRDGEAPHDGPEFAAAVNRLAALIAAHDIGTVCATWRHDMHDDHVAAHLIAAAAAARTGARHFSYPVWGWTLPDEHELPDIAVRGVRLDIAHHLEAKRRAIAAHASQLGEAITDDLAGAVLPERLLVNCTQPYEVFLEPE